MQSTRQAHVALTPRYVPAEMHLSHTFLRPTWHLFHIYTCTLQCLQPTSRILLTSMSPTPPSSLPTLGKRYSANEELGWSTSPTPSTYHISTEEEPEPPSEGGTRAWLTVGGSALVYFATFGIINSFGFFQDYYQRGVLQGVPAATVSLVGTLQITLMNVLAAPVGALFDCYGLRVRICGMSVGVILSGLILLVFSTICIVGDSLCHLLHVICLLLLTFCADLGTMLWICVLC